MLPPIYEVLIGGVLPSGCRDGATLKKLAPLISPGGELTGKDPASGLTRQPVSS